MEIFTNRSGVYTKGKQNTLILHSTSRKTRATNKKF